MRHWNLPPSRSIAVWYLVYHIRSSVNVALGLQAREPVHLTGWRQVRLIEASAWARRDDDDFSRGRAQTHICRRTAGSDHEYSCQELFTECSIILYIPTV